MLTFFLVNILSFLFGFAVAIYLLGYSNANYIVIADKLKKTIKILKEENKKLKISCNEYPTRWNFKRDIIKRDDGNQSS